MINARVINSGSIDTNRLKAALLPGGSLVALLHRQGSFHIDMLNWVEFSNLGEFQKYYNPLNDKLT